MSFRMDWLDLLAVQGTLKSLLQHHSSKASILRRSAFFIVQLSHPYLTTGKTIALTRRTFVGKVMSLLLNMLSRLVITFLPRSKCLLISWLQSPSAVISEPRKIKSDTVSTVSPSISHEVVGRKKILDHSLTCWGQEFQKSQLDSQPSVSMFSKERKSLLSYWGMGLPPHCQFWSSPHTPAKGSPPPPYITGGLRAENARATPGPTE